MSRTTTVRKHVRRTRKGNSTVIRHARTLDWEHLKTTASGKIELPSPDQTVPQVGVRNKSFIDNTLPVILTRIRQYTSPEREDTIVPFVINAGKKSRAEPHIFRDTIPTIAQEIVGHDDRFYIISRKRQPPNMIGILQLKDHNRIVNIYIIPMYRTLNYEFSAIKNIEEAMKQQYDIDMMFIETDNTLTDTIALSNDMTFRKIIRDMMGYTYQIQDETRQAYGYKLADTPSQRTVRIYTPPISAEEV